MRNFCQNVGCVAGWLWWWCMGISNLCSFHLINVYIQKNWTSPTHLTFQIYIFFSVLKLFCINNICLCIGYKVALWRFGAAYFQHSYMMFYPRISRTLIILYTTVTITVWLADFLNDMLYFTNYTAKIVLNRWCEQILSLVSRWLKLSDSWCWVLFTVTLQTLQETVYLQKLGHPHLPKVTVSHSFMLA